MLDAFLAVPRGFKTRLFKPNYPFLCCSLFQVVALGYCQTTVNPPNLFGPYAGLLFAITVGSIDVPHCENSILSPWAFAQRLGPDRCMGSSAKAAGARSTHPTHGYLGSRMTTGIGLSVRFW
jgi:hypothetical protein